MKADADPTMPAPDLPVRVLVVEDETILRDTLAAAVDAEPGLECVGAASTCAEALAAFEAHAPDVVLMDVVLPDGDGIDTTRQILRAAPGTRVLVLTGLTRPDILAGAAEAGAAGFLAKNSRLSAVVEAIRAPAESTMLVEAATLRSLLAEVGRPGGKSPGAQAARRFRLTTRETDVLRLMGEGLDPKGIAERLYVSLHTCRGHIKSLLAKLGAHSQLEAVVIAYREGLLSPPGSEGGGREPAPPA